MSGNKCCLLSKQSHAPQAVLTTLNFLFSCLYDPCWDHRDPPLCQAYAALRITLRTLCMLGMRSLFINSATILAPYFCILNKCLLNELTFICNLIHLKRFTFNFKLCVCPWACISSAGVHRDQRCLILLETEFLADVSCLSFSNYICLGFHKT